MDADPRVGATRTKSIAGANEVQQGACREASPMAGETPALRPRQRLSSLHRLGLRLADCERSERVPAHCYLPPSWRCLPPANYLSFQQYSRLERLSTFVFIYIPAFPGSFPQWPFVFNNIRASFVQFFKLATFSPPLSQATSRPALASQVSFRLRVASNRLRAGRPQTEPNQIPVP
jgi:hypothetical protein